MIRGAGGTPGGFGSFVAGTSMAAAGLHLLMRPLASAADTETQFRSQGWAASSLLLLVGAALPFFDGHSRAGGILTATGLSLAALGVLANLRLYFEPTSLVDTLLVLVLVAGGLGLLSRSLPSPGPPA